MKFFGQEVLMEPTEAIKLLAPDKYGTERGAVVQITMDTGTSWVTMPELDRDNLLALHAALGDLLTTTPAKMKLRIMVVNSYSDGRESVQFHNVEVEYDGSTDEDDLDALWVQLYEYTGDGTGETDKHAYYEVVIVMADEPALVGLKNDWGL